MPYLIDGHNLIPKIPSLSLSAPDDEMQLVAMLQEFCQRRRRTVEVYFDNAPPGQPRARQFGAVTARFVRQGTPADSAIQVHLQRLGRAARNWTVVSSDHTVQASARAVRAQVLAAEEFAALLAATLSASPDDPAARAQPELSEQELNAWLALFGGDESLEE